MASVTDDDRRELERLIREYLEGQGEPGDGLLIETLTCVAVGYLQSAFQRAGARKRTAGLDNPARRVRAGLLR